MTNTAASYDPRSLPRELSRHYISASEKDISEMLDFIGTKNLENLFKSLPQGILFTTPPNLPEELEYEALKERLLQISQKNHPKISFIGDALPTYKIHEIVPFVSSIRNLTTTYTPYQPERSQGTLISHWIYQCLMSMLTGFEAINSSLYDRASALYEAICCSLRLVKNSDTILVSEGIFPQDLEVLQSNVHNTQIKIEILSLDPETGLLSISKAQEKIKTLRTKSAAIAFPQINHFGLIEDVDAITDLAAQIGVKSIAIIDPMLLASGALKPPTSFGKNGVNIIVGEGQHIAIGPNFGGPGLGIFGVRHNEAVKSDIRATSGRFVGKAHDIFGRDAFTMVLSTREQHIRKEKATSNICSNQAFLATLAGAAILARKDQGMQRAAHSGKEKAHEFASKVTTIPGIELAYPDSSFFNEVTLKIPEDPTILINKGRIANLHIGINISNRSPRKKKQHLIKISFSDLQSENDCRHLLQFFEKCYGEAKGHNDIPIIPHNAIRQTSLNLPNYSLNEIREYYQKLGSLNVSPDTCCFPLGSCTMKYNPYVNDWAASLPGFTDIHPQAPIEDTQGCLEVLYEIQEWFKKITGLAGITTQPVAGAQGELVSLKLFQAYHSHHKQTYRKKILIPKSAHGTNFATAIMAGYSIEDIIYLQADSFGNIDVKDLDAKIDKYKNNLCAVMVTNPNTGGLFEPDFKLIADKIHAAGGLVFMDGANLNAIAGWVDIKKLGVDALHSNLHKTWSIPHGGGGPGDAIVAVSEKLVDFLPGYQVFKNGNTFDVQKPIHSIGSFHRHWGNFAHKVRCYTYLLRLGKDGVRRISAMAVLSARYLLHKLKKEFPTLPKEATNVPRMHEFIITLTDEQFTSLENIGIPKAQIIPRVGKLFLDLGYHSPTVAFPEPLGLMIEPTESYSKAELDRLSEAILAIPTIINKNPEYLKLTPKFTPIDRVDEVQANRNPIVSEKLDILPTIYKNRLSQEDILKIPILKLIETLNQLSNT